MLYIDYDICFNVVFILLERIDSSVIDFYVRLLKLYFCEKGKYFFFLCMCRCVWC